MTLERITDLRTAGASALVTVGPAEEFTELLDLAETGLKSRSATAARVKAFRSRRKGPRIVRTVAMPRAVPAPRKPAAAAVQADLALMTPQFRDPKKKKL